MSDSEFAAEEPAQKSVSELKGWLVDFEQKQKPSVTETPSPMEKRAPVKKDFKPRGKISTDEVQATDKGYASVSKVSSWLANDAFKKEKAGLRKDPNVYKKALKFEAKNADDDTDKEFVQEIASAEKKVSDRAAWLQNDAFGGNHSVPFEKTGKKESTVVCNNDDDKGVEIQEKNEENVISDKVPTFEERRKLLIEKEKEAAKKNQDPSNNIQYKTKWKTGSTNGKYTKKLVYDESNAPPKKTLADLP